MVGTPIKVGADPRSIAISPNGKSAYVANYGPNTISVIDTQTNQVVGAPIAVGKLPGGIAVTPDQTPLSSFTAARGRPSVPLAFNASASSDFGANIASYAWSLGDGHSASGGPMLSHTYAKPGSYQVTLTVNDGEGCLGFLFTGQTAYCTGASSAGQTQTVTVAYPGVRLKCPKSARPKGCRFKLRVVSKRRKGKAESAVARAKAKAGHTTVISLKPKKAFAVMLAAAKAVLVKETLTAKGSKRTLVKKLKIVQ